MREARRAGLPVDDVFERREAAYHRDLAASLERSHAREAARAIAETRSLEILEGARTRRRFLRDAAVLAGSAAAFGIVGRAGRAGARQPRIVVVGGGLAGLTAADRIHRARGWVPQVYEAQHRVGGRTRTIRSLRAGQYAEAGGGGISSNEDPIRALAADLGLTPLVDTWLHYPPGPERYRFGGDSYTWSQLKPGVTSIVDTAWQGWKDIGRRIPTRKAHGAVAAAYDAMTVDDLIVSAGVPLSSAAGTYMRMGFGGEYGGPSDQASAIHQILEESDTIWEPGGYDERWAIPGGNDRLAVALKGRLPAGSVHQGHALVAIRRRADGAIRLTFDTGAGLKDVVADRVVMAIPPTTLRQVDIAGAGWSAAKRAWIEDCGMGTGAKLTMQFHGRPWADVGASGDAVTDLTPQLSWQSSHQATDPAILIMLNNRSYGAAPAHGKAGATTIATALADLEQLFPGITPSFIAGQAYLDHWVADPWVRGSYSFQRTGGFTAYNGVQTRPEAGTHFAGEATAGYTRRGTMNGAVESGLRAARELI
jgi:monoamine oxidase